MTTADNGGATNTEQQHGLGSPTATAGTAARNSAAPRRSQAGRRGRTKTAEGALIVCIPKILGMQILVPNPQPPAPKPPPASQPLGYGDGVCTGMPLPRLCCSTLWNLRAFRGFWPLPAPSIHQAKPSLRLRRRKLPKEKKFPDTSRNRVFCALFLSVCNAVFRVGCPHLFRSLQSLY